MLGERRFDAALTRRVFARDGSRAGRLLIRTRAARASHGARTPAVDDRQVEARTITRWRGNFSRGVGACGGASRRCRASGPSNSACHNRIRRPPPPLLLRSPLHSAEPSGTGEINRCARARCAISTLFTGGASTRRVSASRANDKERRGSFKRRGVRKNRGRLAGCGPDDFSDRSTSTLDAIPS